MLGTIDLVFFVPEIILLSTAVRSAASMPTTPGARTL